MADTIYEVGKTDLFNNGWTSKIAWARLYTDTGVLVDQQSVTFTYVTDHIQPTADIVFEVSSATNDISYITLGYTSGLDAILYRKDLSQLYDFTTSGILTVDTFTIGLTGSSLQPDGRQALFTTGWNTTITQLRINNAGGAVGTASCDFDVDGSYDFALDSQVVFEVSAGTNGINNAQLLNSSNTVYWSKTLPSPAPYNFTTAGELRINTWVISI